MFKRDDEPVTREESIAELGSAFLCADLWLSPEPCEGHARCIASWLKALDGDPSAVATAATQARRAVDFLHRMRDAGRAEAAWPPPSHAPHGVHFRKCPTASPPCPFRCAQKCARLSLTGTGATDTVTP